MKIITSDTGKIITTVAGNILTKYQPVSLIKYGKLYPWSETQKQLLPVGWTVPTNTEWTTFKDYIDSVYNVAPNRFGEGNHLKSCRQVNSPLGGACATDVHPRWNEDATNYGRNTVGWSGLPAGEYNSYWEAFGNIGINGTYWSSIAQDEWFAYHARLVYNLGGFLLDTYSRLNLKISIRCFRSATTPELALTDGTACTMIQDYDGNWYDTVKINDKVWIVQNLATSKDTNGNAVTCYDYNNDSTNTFFANAGESIW